MRLQKYILFLVILFSCSVSNAQITRKISYSFQVIGCDTLINAYIPEFIIFQKIVFKNDKERLEYTKLVRDVKKTLPYANLIAHNIIETYEFLETFHDRKSKEKYLKNVQKYMMDEYKPQMKKLTKSQGKILVKLIDRQTNSSAYDIVKSMVGGFKATVYNTVAGLFGNNLKTEYDSEGKDKIIERIVIEIEQGSL